MSDYKYLDPESLKNHFAGDEEMILELLAVFESSYGEIFDGVKASILEKNFKDLQYHAHTLKGMVSNFFSDSIKSACYDLELMGKNETLNDENSKVEFIETGIPALVNEIKNEFG